MSYKFSGWVLEISICACQENPFNSNLLDTTRYKDVWKDKQEMEENFLDLEYINEYYYELDAQLVTAMEIQRK